MKRRITLSEKASILLAELEAGRLVVAKWIGREGTYVRGAIEKNAEWYSAFCRLYSHRHSRRYRKVRTFIKRGCTIRALERLMRGENSGVYAGRLLRFIEEMTHEWRVEFKLQHSEEFAEF